MNLFLRQHALGIKSQLLRHVLHHLPESQTRRAIRERVEEALAIVARQSYPRVQGHSSQERNAHLVRQRLCATRARLEDLALPLALWTHEAAHVLCNADDSDPSFAAKVDLFADVEEGDFLGCCDHDSAVDAAFFEEGVDAEVLVACAGWCIDQEEIQVSPFHVLQELLYQTILLRPSPDDCVVAVG